MVTLVTGATGLVGNNVVRCLLADGQPVRALVRTSSSPRALSGLRVELVRGSVCDPDDALRACQGVERVIHCAGYVQIGWSNLATHRAVNVGGTRNMASASRAVGARMVHVSSVDALGMGTREHPADENQGPSPHILCPYVTSKREAEQAVEREAAAGLDSVIVNPNFVLGPWDWKPSSGRMLLEIARGRGLIAPPGGNDFCDARDVAQGIVAAGARGQAGRRYILGGVPLSYVEAWQLFAKASGVRAPLAVAPQWLLRAAGLAGDAWGKLCRREPDVNSAATAISARPHHYSSARAIAELGYHVRDIRETVNDTWDWFVRAGYC
ncbi:MAG: NAD-dependent epimerase/dehydratase family protein [Pirellulales bacterium]|nr:NAD-dependent epimerase/dehydratase family protein [Pirellulales bacterium]